MTSYLTVQYTNHYTM